MLLSAIVSGLSYSYFTHSSLFIFRSLSFVTLLVFYILTFFHFSSYLKKMKAVRDKSLIVFLLILLVLLVIFFNLNLEALITVFFHPLAFPAFFMGIFAYLINMDSIDYLSKLSTKALFILPITTIVDLVVFNYPISLQAGYSFLLFAFLFANSKNRLIIILFLFISIILFALYDHRAGIIIVSLFLLIAISKSLYGLFKLRAIRFSFLLVVLYLTYLVFFNFSEYYTILTASIGEKSINTIDTRSFLFIEFFEDFKSQDYLFGRGYLGTYYSPYFKNWTGEAGDSFNRFSVEIGFMEIFLKGGIALLIFISFLFIRSIYKGFVLSKVNSWTFIAAMWLLIEFCMMAIENVPMFNIHFLFIWVLIGGIYSSESKQKVKQKFAL